MKEVFTFGKIACRNPKIKNNAVTVEVEWKPNSKGRMVFSACGYVWNNLHTDIIMGGQCLDELMEYPSLRNNATFKEIYRLWKNYHLNDMHAGTALQESAIKSHFGDKPHGYKENCEFLKEVGLYEVRHPETGEPYQYGHGWIYKVVPPEDVQKIVDLLERGHV